MYRKPDGQMAIEDFILPFEGKLKADNRWVKMAQIIPWDEIEQEYASLFENEAGNVAKPARMALGALIIKEKCGYCDIETVEQIQENPYLQYFIGFKEYTTEAPFDPSLMVHFRKRFNMEAINAINEKIFKTGRKDKDDPPPTGGGGKKGKQKIKNKGKLIIDATCAPTEFRAKLSISLIDADVFLDKLEIESAKRYHERTGYYPASVHTDAIYRNRDNLNLCKAHGIRLSGPRLGRSPKVVSIKDKKLARQDAKARITVEGAFGVAKRRNSLGLIMTRLQETSESVIAMQFLVMNLSQRLRFIRALFSKNGISLKEWLFLRFTAKIAQTFAFN